jgi:hypothetical protein
VDVGATTVGSGVVAAPRTTKNGEQSTTKLHVYLTLGAGDSVLGAEGATSAGAT